MTENKINKIYPLKNFFDFNSNNSPNFPKTEENILNFWNKSEIFKKSIEKTENGKNFVFYDGPPFANGLPHFGHLLTGYVKDIIPRYFTMKGQFVSRRFGWDCHGLPAELEAEKQLGITEKSQIDSMGLEKFNEYCRTSVMEYANQWADYINRQGRWIDMENDYKTMDLDYMESVIWAFKKLYDNGLIYQGYRVVPYSWAEQTSMSNHETRLDDSFRMRQDPALTVGFKVDDKKSKFHGASILIWTTTPWTLPSNLAVAINDNETYVVVKNKKEKFIIAEKRLSNYKKELGDEPKILESFQGSELVGAKYVPPFNFFRRQENAFRVLSANFVTMDSGTGIVHIAPGFGEEDLELAKANDIQIVQPLDAAGRFTDIVSNYAGIQIFDANPLIIKDLKQKNVVLRHETIEHSYPHSWRSGQPLIYMALPAWFLAVTKFKDDLIKNNQEINWLPEHIKDGQFGKWLEGAKDWNISRTRYWGTPLPVWISDNEEFPRIDVYGSLDEIEKDFGIRPNDLHRPYIDNLTRPNPDDPTGKSLMRRVPDILDGWFDSGSMPFAQQHYPFENKDLFENNFPGDFIVEYIAQTRGWFYTMHVISTALFNKPAFRNVVAHGVVLAEDGQKMSKSKQNYVDVNLVFDNYGSDAMRWFLVSSTILNGGNLAVSEQNIKEATRQAILPFWNSFSFLHLYAEETASWSVSSENILDKYIFSKLIECRNIVTDAFNHFDIPTATLAIRDFLEILTNWYIRRSRNRFWEGQKKYPEAFNTLYTVLEIFSRIVAPLLPFISESVWKGLTGDESVHLAEWPSEKLLNYDVELAKEMDIVRDVCSTASSIRKKHNLRARLPLNSVTIAHKDSKTLEKFSNIIKDEINVKNILFKDNIDEFAKFELQINAKILGPRIGKKVQDIIKSVKNGDWEENKGNVVVLDELLRKEEYNLVFKPKTPENTALMNSRNGLVILDLELDEELEKEGWAKDKIREFQQSRKDNNFDVSDRINVQVWVAENRISWLKDMKTYIASEILASNFEIMNTNKNLQKVAEDMFINMKKL